MLDVAAKDTIIVGMVGNLEPGTPGFRKHLERFRRTILFLGIRCGNLWGRDFEQRLPPGSDRGPDGSGGGGIAMDTEPPNPRLLGGGTAH